MTFWLTALAFVAAAGAFAAWPLLRGTAGRTEGDRTAASTPDPLADADAMVRALYQDRLAELRSETRAGRLDDETRAEVEEELGANLLAEYQRERAVASESAQAPADDAAAGRRSSVFAGWLLAGLLPLAAVAVYLSVGEPTAGEIAGASVVLRLDPAAERAELERWRNRLARRVEAEPGDEQSWYLLGIARLQLGDHSAAADALSRAQSREAPDPNIDLYWLQARYLASGGQLDDLSRSIAERLLAVRPNHPMVLEMFAIDAYRQEDYLAAVGYLNRALMNDLGDTRTAGLLAGLAQARSRLGDLRPTVEVDISAAEGVPADATLFVIARPPGGGMPYAVVRRPAALLPLSVRLDDTVSMNPALQLSQAGPIEVVVRLSRTGAPAAGPGDWEWRSDTLALADQDTPLRLTARLVPPPATEPATQRSTRGT